MMDGSMVDHPKHCNVCGERAEDGTSAYEPIKIIEDWGLDWGFCLGCAIKHLLWAAHKGEELEDLRKAHWYLRRLDEDRPEAGVVRIWPKQCTIMGTAMAWKLSGRRLRVLELIAAAWPSQAADELERELDEHFPTWREQV